MTFVLAGKSKHSLWYFVELLADTVVSGGWLSFESLILLIELESHYANEYNVFCTRNNF